MLGKGSKTPVTENVRDGGTPRPLPPSRKAAGQKVNGKKITEKGVPPPPPPITESGRPKNLRKKVSGKGGYPPSPITESNLEFFLPKMAFYA